MVSGQLSALLLDWTSAVTDLNIPSVHTLLEKEPELLWTPIPHALDDLDHLENQLIGLNRLGSSFQPVCAIQFTLLHYQDVNHDTQQEQLDRFKFLSYLIEQSTLHDLDTRFWGECNNSTLHLVCFLEHEQIVQLLIEKGVSVTPSNDLGYLPKDVTSSDLIVNYLETAPVRPVLQTKRVSKRISTTLKKPQLEILRSKSVRPNYSTPDRFKLLKELAEESSIVGDDKKTTTVSLDRKKSEGHYFRKGRVKETQQMVLTEEEVVELKKQKEKRQLEVAQLVKKSAVKNNPLFKKLEKRSYISPTPSPSTSTNLLITTEEEEEEKEKNTILEELTTNTTEETTKPKRNSKVISSLKTKSYVSSSIFVQADEENPVLPPPPTPIPTISLTTSHQEEEISQETTTTRTDFESSRVTMDYLSGSSNETQGSTRVFSNEPNELEQDQDYNNYYTIRVEKNGQLKVQEELMGHTTDEEDEEYYYEAAGAATPNEALIESLTISTPLTNQQPVILQQKNEHVLEDEEEEDIHIYPSNNYYDLAINIKNMGNPDVNYSPSSVLEQTTSSDNDDDDEEEEEEYSDDDDDDDDDDDEEEEEEDAFEEATPVQFATRLTSPVYKSVVIFNEESKSNEVLENKSDEVEGGFESTIQKAFFGDSSNLDISSPKKEENDFAHLYHSNMSRISDDSGVEVENHREQEQQEEEEEEEKKKMKVPSMVTTSQFIVEPTTSSGLPMRPQRSDLRRESNASNNDTSLQPQETVETIVSVIDESKEKKRMSGSQKAAWTMSMSSWAAILDREFNLDEVDANNKLKQHKKLLEEEEEAAAAEQEQKKKTPRQSTVSMTNYLSGKLQLDDDDEDDGVNFIQHMQEQGDSNRLALNTAMGAPSTLSLSSTLKIRDSSLPPFPTPKRSSSYYHSGNKSITPLPRPPQIGELPRLQSSKSISRKPIAASLSESALTKKNISSSSPKQYNAPTHGSKPFMHVDQRITQQGKLYLHVNGIQDILLPLPKERAYVRCVVSDGRFEYMSRYEILAQNINFDYECVIDTHPDMIITISLHVRPDYVMKSKTPFSRLFSSKKKKESLSGYVNKEDGAIGQARFALAHMLPACTETTYLAGFHCFNAWYSRSFKERHRQKKKNDPDQDVLKVVGNFDVEMLYLSMVDYQKPFPRNLRECDIAIKELHRSATNAHQQKISPSSETSYHHAY